MKLYTGIDLHSNNHYVCVIDQDNNRLVEKRLTNDLIKTLELLEPYREQMVGIAIESTYNWYWLGDGLINHGYHVELVNTVAVQSYSGLKHTDDKSDAFWLAHLMSLDLLPTGYIMPPEQRALRDLLRRRMQLVEDRTSHILRVQSQLTRSFAIRTKCDDIKALRIDINALTDDPNIRCSVRADLECIAALNKQIDTVKKLALAQCRQHKAFKLLQSIYGVGPILAMTIMAEVGQVDRFAKVGNLSSYCRCVSANRFSNGKKKGVNNSKNGNKYLAWAMVEAANYAAMHYERAREFVRRKTAQKNRTVAIKALAHKLTKASYYILRDEVPFNPDKLFS